MKNSKFKALLWEQNDLQERIESLEEGIRNGEGSPGYEDCRDKYREVSEKIDKIRERAGKFAEGLRNLALFLENNPEVADNLDQVQILRYLWEREAVTDVVKSYTPLEKQYDQEYFHLFKKFSEFVSIRWYTNREQVCTKVVTGTMEVVIPAQPERVETREKVEWKCLEPLLS